MRKLVAAVVIVLLFSGIAGAWDIQRLEYNASTSTLKINYDLNPFEGFLAFILGGEFSKKITENFILGNYTLVHAGFTSVTIQLNETVHFKEPVAVKIVNGNESYFLTNVTELRPEFERPKN
ncbi:hypothetical protein [Geoglobus acetivorans]|uniref:Uncharacterized protein n=1 Tax=Geoglobus acetivorans TaxID=565033 RepID=A0A0A7GFK7_GEOAI|nr:hypothetical protein GACE_1807 [Geoglobus acetivorans]